MLVKRIAFYDFLEEFKKFGREGQFSYQGLKALFEYLEELSEDLGQPIELDVIGLCSEFSEYSSIEEFNEDYALDLEDIEDIEDYTTVIPIDKKSFIIQDF